MRGDFYQHKYDTMKTLLKEQYRTLHLNDIDGQWIIQGVFPVRANGIEVDTYLIEILVPERFPDEIPLVKELGGRIKHHPDWHVYIGGYLCVFLPLERWKHLPQGSTILTFLNGALNDYLFSQTYFERYGEWALGERGHGFKGVREYLSEELGNVSVQVMKNFLLYLANGNPKGHWMCYCGSGKKLRDCHFDKLTELSNKISRADAMHALRMMLP